MVKTRFAPSPTGQLHIGNIRTALFSWAFARRLNGEFHVRFEDTDDAREVDGSAESALAVINRLGLKPDSITYQSDNFGRHHEVLAQMLNAGTAYREDNGAVCMKLDTNLTQWRDLIMGNMDVPYQEETRLVLARAPVGNEPFGTPLYNFCVVVDDHDMGITHVIRGDGHVPNTPKQLGIYKALGWQPPHFAHLPIVLGGDGKPLSKRNGSMSCIELFDQGFIQPGIINYLAKLGWAHGDDEIFSPEQFINWFSLDAVSRSPARFDKKKLEALNFAHLKALDDMSLTLYLNQFMDGRCTPAIATLIRGRAKTLVGLAKEAQVVFERPIIELPKLDAISNNLTWPQLSFVRGELPFLSWNKLQLEGVFKDPRLTPEGLNVLRYLLTGKESSPNLIDLTFALGKNETINRLRESDPLYIKWKYGKT